MRSTRAIQSTSKRACALALTVAVLPAPAAAVPMFRGGPQHTGIYEVSGLPTLHGLKWKFQTGGPVLSSPVLSKGTLFIGSADHKLYALRVADGGLQWKFETAGRVSSTPALADGMVFSTSYDSYFYALDAATGRLIWRFRTQGERRFAAAHLHGAEPAAETMPDPFDAYLSSPVASKDRVYFGSGDHNVYALDTKTGEAKWRFKSGDDSTIHNQVGFQSSAPWWTERFTWVAAIPSCTLLMPSAAPISGYSTPRARGWSDRPPFGAAKSI